VWHEGITDFKTIIHNKKQFTTTTNYILMSDGDCILIEDFVEQHISLREEVILFLGSYNGFVL
jgi:hypothetical protein